MTLDELFTISKGKKPPVLFDEPAEETIPFIQIDAIRKAGQPQYCEVSPNLVTCERNDVLVVWDGAYCGLAGFGLEGAIGSTIARLRPKSANVFGPYAGHFLRSRFPEIQKNSTGAAIPHVNGGHLRRLEIPLPPLVEQRRIAAVLDKADALRRRRQDSLELTEKLLQSVFIDMFGTGEQPRCPRSKLSDHLDFITSGGRGWSKYYAAEGDMFIRSLDVRMNEINESEMVRVKAPKNAEADRTRVRVGDVLLTITGSLIGRAAPVSERHSGSYISQHVAILRTHGFLPEFLAWAISMDEGQRQIRRHQTGQTKPGLNFEQIGRLMIPRPSEAAEGMFVQLIQRRHAILAEQREAANQTERLFASIQQRTFQGELDLTRLKLDEEAETLAAKTHPEPVIIQDRYHRPGSFIAPPEIEAQMLALEYKLNKDPKDLIQWSEDYFKYRTLSQVLQPPFSFTDIWRAVESDIEEPSYETVKDKIFAHVEDGTLEQRFDDERKEIVFYPRA
jgi:type I restriction enzyme S subunit